MAAHVTITIAGCGSKIAIILQQADKGISVAQGEEIISAVIMTYEAPNQLTFNELHFFFKRKRVTEVRDKVVYFAALRKTIAFQKVDDGAERSTPV